MNYYFRDSARGQAGSLYKPSLGRQAWCCREAEREVDSKGLFGQDPYMPADTPVDKIEDLSSDFASMKEMSSEDCGDLLGEEVAETLL